MLLKNLIEYCSEDIAQSADDLIQDSIKQKALGQSFL
jgi:hypothetical protein